MVKDWIGDVSIAFTCSIHKCFQVFWAKLFREAGFATFATEYLRKQNILTRN